jgi:predicted ATPase/class 3 adenylate cyclase
MDSTEESSAHGNEPGRFPTGAVTFLFTDIEGSTERWERHREAMKAAMARHDALLRSAIESHEGYVFKTVGDAFCAAFSNALDAIEAALTAQRSIAQEDWSLVDGLTVRAGLHTGQADERDGDYFGPVVNRVARLMSTAHGGQIILSAAVAALARESLATDVSLVDLGKHGLKDLTEPEHVFQLTCPDLRSEFPALRSLDARPNNLPIQLSNLIGRERDIADARKRLDSYRLVTLTGAGGVGKTRLALQLGAELLNDYPDGVWFVELAALSDPELIAGAVAAVLSIRTPADRTPAEALVESLRHRQILLILDNSEHILAECATLTVKILGRCPNVRMLVTSREPLHVDGECVYRVPSLAIPESGEALDAQSLGRFGAIALFNERAVASGAHFTVSDANARVVANICRRLDGIPLAIELAAARVRVLSVSDIAQRLDDRFHLLEGGTRTALPRQRTLRALIDWSHELLAEPERVLFRRLSVFSGTFGINAATNVCTDDRIPAGDILNLLSSLDDKSLVAAEHTSGDPRFRMLESIRDFADERLVAAGERHSFRCRHAAYYRDLAITAQREYSRREEAAGSLEALHADLDNCRSAMDWAFGEGADPELGSTIATNMSTYWETHGLESEGLARLETALDRLRPDGSPASRAAVLVAITSLAYPTRQFRRSLDAAQRAAQIARALGDDALLGRALRAEGDVFSQFGRYDEAAQSLEQALVHLRAAHLDRLADGCLQDQGMNENARGRFDAARRVYEELRERFRAQGDLVRFGVVTLNLAETEFGAGNTGTATNLLEEIVPVFEAAPHFILAVRCNLASYLLAAGETERAKAVAHTALQLCEVHGYGEFAIVPLETLALVAAIESDVRKAARIVGFTEAAVKASDAPRERTEQLGYDRLMDLLRKSLSQAELERHLAAGAAMPQEMAIQEALAI